MKKKNNLVNLSFRGGKAVTLSSPHPRNEFASRFQLEKR